MIRHSIVAVGILLGVLGVPSSPVHARVSVSIGIDLPGPPPLEPIPGTVIMYAPATPANYFFYAGQYWVFVNGGWYVSAGYNGPWAIVAPAYVPRPLLVVPVRYFRVPPRAWRHWRPDAPPRWRPGWGRRWVEHREPPRPERRERLHREHEEHHREREREERR